MQWWRRWWARGRKTIFQYWDGYRWRYADPMVTIQKLQTHPTFKWSEHPIAADLGDFDASNITANAVRDAFDLPPFDADSGDGRTNAECIRLLAEFVGYLDGVKKNGSPSPNPPPSTEPASSPSMESPLPSDTNASSDSTGASAASESVTPSPSPKESD